MTSGCLSFHSAAHLDITPAVFSTRAISSRSNKLNHESSSYQHQILGLGPSPHPPSFVRGSKAPISIACAAAKYNKPIAGDRMLVRELNVLEAALKPWNSLQFGNPSCSAGGSAMAELGRILINEASRDWLIIPILRAVSVLAKQIGSVLPAKQTYLLASVHRVLITCSASNEDGAPSKGSVHFGSAEDTSSPIQPTVGDEAENVRVQSRRSFFGACLFGLAAVPIGCHGEEAVAATTRQEVAKEAPSPFDESRLLQQNRRMQKLNGAPIGFPGFIREGFNVKVVTDQTYVTTKTGLIYFDLVEGHGEPPQDGQQVIFHYTGYNEAGRRVDSSYQQGQPARTRVGINGMIPGFEEGIKSMRVGGKRRIIIPPDLGPPVGPSTFFSAKQFEVFDVELLDVKSCTRRTVFLYSDVVCE